MKNLIGLTAVFLYLLVACAGIENYEESDGPLFDGEYAETPVVDDGVIKLISWNIKFGEEVETAIAELQETAELQNADFILLQEMDETAVADIAQALNYNYIYYPASVHNQHDKNFGNAILSQWPLSDPQKILLPHENPKNEQTRNAVKATAVIGEHEIDVISVHTETAWLSAEKRNEQIDALVAAIDPEAEMVIVGGDFNTIRQAEVTAVADRFAEVGMTQLSAGAEPTVMKLGLKFSPDHVFARGLSLIENGVWQETEASDHFPVWLEMSLAKKASE
jgi:endonuclease/exonuclease/phosphatase family metal-dependent hydrolase